MVTLTLVEWTGGVGGKTLAKLGAEITEDVTAVGVMVTLTLMEWTGGVGGKTLANLEQQLLRM